ncbi:TIGR03013 family PEP-CTERM/XrtA system glycosyltransferase [Thalassotalea euphylliae]|uniref:TIGR03013 family PEP-CTERM/XrtA system glycosyltransferase n=1 Tax=Thalassotalea euphylliae TaxID=1655234 RepID=A0A3E0TMC5_9GAMM|nr:TIGR03013 family XrtA/PEP-CTERM system glycosyltransferase [Thalassotalea euphylliae]REL25195.1 TIGR03013 family PEP-CTERM/XrtA system glycosyltransferase [Thalassotalea euphylliae]
MPVIAFRDLSINSKSFVLLELLVFMAGMLIAVALNNQFQIALSPVLPSNFLFIYALVFGLVSQLTSLALGLYNSKLRENFRGLFRRILLAVAIAFSIVALINPLYSSFALPIEVLGLASLSGLVLVLLLRYGAHRIDFFGFHKRKVLVIGAGQRASIIEKRMRRDVDRQSFKVHAYVKMTGDSPDGIERETKISLDGSLVSYALDNEIDEIVVANDERRNNLPVDELFACKIRGIEVTEILDFIERETGQIAVNLIYPSWVIYSNGFTSTNYLRNTLDWLFNAAIAFTLLLITWPVMLLTAIIIKLDDGFSAPIFYRQERVGVDGHPFYIVKFRSMRVDAEKNGAQWASENDDRTTRIGNFIRKYRIDELPQIYNVMRGDMGFVGPRPERPEFVQNLVKSIPYYNERHNVKPGLAGWAQLKYPYGATEADALEKLKYDLYYIKHRSFFLDLLILIRTVEIVVFGKGR